MVKLWVFCQFGEQCFLKMLCVNCSRPFVSNLSLLPFTLPVSLRMLRGTSPALFIMLEKAGLPFRKSLRSAFEAENGLTDIPLLFSIPVDGVTALKTTTHSTDLQVPVVPMLGSIEVSSIAFNTAVGSLQRKVYLFMQRLDCDGKATGPPVPLAVTNTVQFSVPLKLKLFAGDRARLVLYQSGTGLAVSEVILSGCILASADCYFASGRTLVAMSSWTPEPFRFVRDSTMSASRKRSNSPQPMRNQKNCVSSDEPPTLIYAPVFGGDDES
ncbi:conserved hypothetical protein [Leishmania braziliensis MHOM/BR/75/M2904]|uniref:Uncharacterized protein n=2 Tax=Leishmania braziliensis TaxID=5660 RepID=A4H7Z4_LEIBR|nr:conserved hypothetical protein [Leishmania braziliensis MHOM/BR/75/M2904]CAJ2469249.1 unnamed protein product [Leishmania braziliensis]CAM42041.1 conserved hypothetical protein [Leishmania braziliensis MHOM/BR/75/M2904]